MTKKKYLQELIEEELNKDKNSSFDETVKNEGSDNKPSEKTEDDNLEENKKKKCMKSEESPADNDEKKSDAEKKEENDDSEDDDSEDDDDDQDKKGDDDKKPAGDIKNEAVEQLIEMVESGLSSHEIAERIFKVTQESVLEAVNKKTENLEDSIEEKYTSILESQISELEKEFVLAAKDIVSKRIAVLESEYQEIAEENKNYKEVIDNILSVSEDFDDKISGLEEENQKLKTQNQILENTVLFKDKIKNFVMSDIDRLNTVITEESFALGKKDFEKALDEAFEKFNLTETVEDKKSSEVRDAPKNVNEEHLDIIESARALKNKTFWF